MNLNVRNALGSYYGFEARPIALVGSGQSRAYANEALRLFNETLPKGIFFIVSFNFSYPF